MRGVRQDVGDDEPPARLQHPCRLGQRERGLRHVVQDVHDQRQVERPGLDRQRFEAAFVQVDVGLVREALAGDGEHLGRGVDGDHRGDEGCKRRGDPARSAAQVADDGGGRQQRGEDAQVAGGAEQLGAEVVPLPGGGGEELDGADAAAVEHRLQAAAVMPGLERGGDVDADELPEPLRRLGQAVDGEPVVARGAVPAGSDPAGVAERLQVPRDGALRQRERVAQLGHGQLDAVQNGQQTAARRVGKQGQSVEDGRAERDCFR